MVDLHGTQCGFCTPGLRHVALRALDARPEAVGGRDRGGAAGQPLPLHRLPADRRRGEGGRRASPADDPLVAERARVRAAPRRPRRRRPRRHPHAATTASSCRPPSTTSPRCSRRRRRRPSSPARPTSGSGSPSSCATSRPRSSSPTSTELQGIAVTRRGRPHRRRRQLRHLPVDPRRRVPAPLRLLAPDRRLAGARDGHRRRQRRQRLADRRHAARR